MKWDVKRAARSEILFHLHIPKTAGTSLREAFREALPDEEFLEWHPKNPYAVDESIEELRNVLAARPKTRVVTGHFLYGVHRALQGQSYCYATVMRNPVARALSHYMHELQNNLPLISEENRERILTSSISEYIVDTPVSYFYNNIQSRFISGMSSGDFSEMSSGEVSTICLDLLQKDFAIVGSQENLTEVTSFFSDSIGISQLAHKQENIRGRLNPEKILPLEDYYKIFQANRADCELIKNLELPIELTEESTRITGSVEKLALATNKTMRLCIKNLLAQNQSLRKVLSEVPKS